jgi:CRP-like cAMP-binding protein
MPDIAAGNALLRSLLPGDLKRLTNHGEFVDLALSQVLYEMDDPVTWVYFPEIGLLSIISVMNSGDAIETSIVGREGGVGFIEAVGGRTMFSRVLVQVPGRAFRVRDHHYRAAFDASPTMRRAVQQQAELLLAESRQAIACHSLHRISQRFNRWMLECQDLSGGLDVLPLKQEFLAVMLGVTRTSVTAVATAAQESGLIKYTRGSIRIVDREGLERGACECRAFLQRLRRALEPDGIF